MTALEFLESYKKLNTKINLKLEQLEQLKASATKTTSLIGCTPGSSSPAKSRMEEIIVRYSDLENRINAEIDSCYALKLDILDIISQLSDDRYRLLIEMRYLEDCSWEEVGDKLYLSRASAYRLRKPALAEVQRILDNENGKNDGKKVETA